MLYRVMQSRYIVDVSLATHLWRFPVTCAMSRVDDVGNADGWRCWLCDEPVDPKISVNDARGPSVDSLTTKTKKKSPNGGGDQRAAGERLAHRSCNTKKGAIAAVVRWPEHLFVVDPAAIIGSVERLQRKGGREIMARCPTKADAQDAADWLVDRISRLCPDWPASTHVEAGGGQFLVVLKA